MLGQEESALQAEQEASNNILEGHYRNRPERRRD